MYEVIHSEEAIIKIKGALQRYRKETGSDYYCVVLRPRVPDKSDPEGFPLFTIHIMADGETGERLASSLMDQEFCHY